MRTSCKLELSCCVTLKVPECDHDRTDLAVFRTSRTEPSVSSSGGDATHFNASSLQHRWPAEVLLFFHPVLGMRLAEMTESPTPGTLAFWFVEKHGGHFFDNSHAVRILLLYVSQLCPEFSSFRRGNFRLNARRAAYGRDLKLLCRRCLTRLTQDAQTFPDCHCHGRLLFRTFRARPWAASCQLPTTPRHRALAGRLPDPAPSIQRFTGQSERNMQGQSCAPGVRFTLSLRR